MNKLTERIKQCRHEIKVSQRKVADYLQISERAYQHYELGTREPNVDTLILLANYFDVSLDYLCGRTDIR